MALESKTYDVTNLIGNQADFAPLVDGLAALVQRTVQPESWFKTGGTGTLRPFFNQVKKKWYLVVFSDQQADVKKVLDELNV